MTIKIPIISTYNDKGVKKATKSIGGLEGAVKKLAPVMAAAFSVTAITAFGKASVRAFMQDEKALNSLNQTLKNTGNMYATSGVTKFIADLEAQTGVLDDHLRPAFQSLLIATGSVTESQKALSLALDISAGTGKTLEAVGSALAKGYSGQTTALSKLSAGLSKSTLKSGDMEKITGELSKIFSGQAATAAETYAGKMARLNVASENAKETIGKGLVDAFTLLAGNRSIDTVIDKIGKLAQDISDLALGIVILTNKIKAIPGIGVLGDFFGFSLGGSIIKQIKGLGTAQRLATAPSADRVSSATLRGQAAANRAALKIQKEKNALAAIEAAILKAKLLAEADQKTLDTLKRKFDLDRISITAALAAATDEQTRTVLQGQLAILDGDAKVAQASLDKLAKMDEIKLISAHKQSEITDATGEQLKIMNGKIDAATAAFNALGIKTVSLDEATNSAVAGLQNLANGATILGGSLAAWRVGERYNAPAMPAPNQAPIPISAPISNIGGGEFAGGAYTAPVTAPQTIISTIAPSIAEALSGFTDSFWRAGERGDNINVTVNAGIVGSEQVIANEVQKVLQNFNRWGTSTNYAGSIDQ